MIRTPPDCALIFLQQILKRSQEEAHDIVAGPAAGTATSCEHSLQNAAVQREHERAQPRLGQTEAAPTSRKRGRAVAEQAVKHNLAETTAAGPQIPAAKRSKPISQDKLLSGLLKRAQKRAATQHQGAGRVAGRAVRQTLTYMGTHAMQTAHAQQQQQQQQLCEQQEKHQLHGLQQQGSIPCMGGPAQCDKLSTTTALGIASHGSACLVAAADALEQALARQGSSLGNTLPPAAAAAATGEGSDTWQQFAAEAGDSGGSSDVAAGNEYADFEALWNAELQTGSITALQAAPQQAAAACAEQGTPALLGGDVDMPAAEAATAGKPVADTAGTTAAAAAPINAGSAPADTAQPPHGMFQTATGAACQQQAVDTELICTNATTAEAAGVVQGAPAVAAAAEAVGMEQSVVVVNTVAAAAAESTDAAEPLERQGVAVALQQEDLRSKQQHGTQYHWQQQQEQLQWAHQQEQQQCQPEPQWQHAIPEQQQAAHQHTACIPAGSPATIAPAAAAAAAAAAAPLVPAPAQQFTLAELLLAVPELPIKAVATASSKQAGQAAQGQQAAGHRKGSCLVHGAAGAGDHAAAGGRLPRTSATGGGQLSSFGKRQQGQGHTPQQHKQQQQATAQAQQVQQQHHRRGRQQPSQQGTQPAESLQQECNKNIALDRRGVSAAAAAGASSSSDEEGELICSDNEAAAADHPQSVFELTAGPGATTRAAADAADASPQGGTAQAAGGGGGGDGATKRAKKSRAGKKVRLRRAEAQRDAAAAAAGGSGDVKLGLYAEIKAWEKEQAAKTRKAGGPQVDAAKELRFSITGKAPCKFWQAGRCSKGEACSYLHAGQPAVQLVACKFHQRGACRAGESCKFSHAALAELPCPELALYHKCPRPTGACPYQHDTLEAEVALALRRLLMKMQQQQEEAEQQQQRVQAGIPAGSLYQAQQQRAVPMPQQQQQAGLQDAAGYPAQQYSKQPQQMQAGTAGGQMLQLQQWQQPQACMQLQQPHMMQAVGVHAFQQQPHLPEAQSPGGHGVAAQQHHMQQQQPAVPNMQQRGPGIQRRG